MSDLRFSVEGVEAKPYAAVPTIAFRLQAVNADASQAIQSVAVRCQIMIEASRRQYRLDERDSLLDLFGEPERWSRTLRPLLWTHASVTVPAFSGSTAFELLVPCTFDFNVGAAKFFHAVKTGEIPLCFQFSGTIFYAAANGALQIDQIGWDKEARFRLPSNTWHDVMDHYYPNSAWLRLRLDTFERLYEYKRYHGIATWEEAIERLLPVKEEVAS